MARHIFAFGDRMILATILLALAALPVAAGPGGRGGYYGGYRGGYYRGHYGPYRGYGGAYVNVRLYGYRPYPYYGLGLGVVVGSPAYVPYPVVTGPALPATDVAVPDPALPAAPAPDAPAAPKVDGKARLMLLVPANAEVWFDGKLRTEKGTEREFISPVLVPDKVYVYTVRVRYPKDDGTVFDETRPIKVRADDRWLVDFTRPAPQRDDALPEVPPAP
jgi:uncharacterized protein (TIGR03000 family)